MEEDLDVLDGKLLKVQLLEARRDVMTRRVGCERKQLDECYANARKMCGEKNHVGCQDAIQEMHDIDNEILVITADLIESIDILDFKKNRYTVADCERVSKSLNGMVVIE